MDELMNRSRTFAEAVVTMVWLVLLGAALEGKSQVTGLDVPKFVLILACPTIITGICPLLACCIFKNQRSISDVAALLAAAILFSLACWIALFTVWNLIVLSVASVSLVCTVARTYSYCVAENRHPERSKEFHTVLDGSHEFLCSTTGIHFLWLESMALEGLIRKRHGKQEDLTETMGILNILCCAIGLCTIVIQMTPPLGDDISMSDIAWYFFMLDSFMIISIGAVLGVAMLKSLVFQELQHILGTILIVGLLLIVIKYVYFREEVGASKNEDPPKLAPLGLTKLMVTGFLAVYLSVDSTHRSITHWFLAFAAAAIFSGLTWRLLTQVHVKKVLENNKLPHVSQAKKDSAAAVASSANTACFCAHTFVAIAALLLMIEIYNVKQSMSAAGLAPAPVQANTNS